MTILFLDFDGVLHPYGCAATHYFCRLPRLAAMLRERAEVEVVIASDWRLAHTLTELRAIFPRDLRARVVGVTPRLGSTAQVEAAKGLRRREAMSFLAQRGLTRSGWLAVDDWAHLWAPVDDHVVVCDSVDGLDDVAAENLLRRIAGEAASGRCRDASL